MMPVSAYIYIGFILVAFLSSLVSWRRGVDAHFKIFSCLLGLTFLVEAFAAFFVLPARFRPAHAGSFARVYTVFLLVEFWVYGYFFYRVIRVVLLRRIVFGFLVGFPLFWLGNVAFLYGFHQWNSYVLIVGSFFTIVFVLLYYFQLITDRDLPSSLSRIPEFWIASGMLLFYLGALPYFGTLSWLMHHHLSVGSGGLVEVLRGLDILMYGLIAYGFWCTVNRR